MKSIYLTALLLVLGSLFSTLHAEQRSDRRLVIGPPQDLSGAIGSWKGAGWYIYWLAPKNSMNSQLHRGPYSSQAECEADLQERHAQQESQDRSLGIVPTDIDRCGDFENDPDFDRAS